MGNLPSVCSTFKMDEFCNLKVQLRLKKKKKKGRNNEALESLYFVFCFIFEPNVEINHNSF